MCEPGRAFTMPSRAPTYFHWSEDKPCTTNQTYGYFLSGYLEAKEREMAGRPKARMGAFDYTRPFSNSRFFPEIAHAQKSKSDKQDERIKDAVFERLALRKAPRFNINDGYSVGAFPIYKRVAQRDAPAGVRVKRYQSAPSTYRPPVAKENDIYLWHTLSGSLVHVKQPNEEYKALKSAFTCS